MIRKILIAALVAGGIGVASTAEAGWLFRRCHYRKSCYSYYHCYKPCYRPKRCYYYHCHPHHHHKPHCHNGHCVVEPSVEIPKQ